MMKMTEQAASFLKKEMAEKKEDTLRFYNLAGCCHPTLTAEFEPAEDGDKIEIVEHIRIAIEQAVVDDLKDVTIGIDDSGEEVELVLDGYVFPDACDCEEHDHQ
ncbi:hypothetical protein [Rummeliibacillus suwonensis]|jgi:hypothetical protein|uniref:hypothetical protein n=1 Tax=Rummeliibacillus suwonensis TaxID=1306154 RepID=UPI0011B6FB94|nr:hypothetical protein [Rummeliibacillus suwonensis]MBO2536221.1 hypothetical protein [Rummeliibacillus suwonensis]